MTTPESILKKRLTQLQQGMSKSVIAEDKRSEQGVWLLLASLSMFFIGSTILYAVYVVLHTRDHSQPIQPLLLPRTFILTTITLIAISILLHMAVGAIRRERRTDLARYIVIAFVLSLAFFVIQGTALVTMLAQMLGPTATRINLYGLTYFFVLVHALHVVGGVAGLTFLLFGIRRDAYDHERHFPIRFCAMYWHFLDVVWVAMFASFVLAAYVSRAVV